MATLYRNFLAGVVDDNPLSSGATTLTSSGLANLPVVTAPDIMWLVLDPDAVDGAPELVKVTAHTSSATTATIDRAEQNTAARAHNQNTDWRIVATQTDFEEFLKSVDSANIVSGAIDLAHLAAEIQDLLVPAGTIRATVNTSADDGWLLFNQTVVGAQSSYPALWAVAPAGWKSGADLVLPNLNDTVLMDAGSVATLGSVSGANTSTALLAHTHTGPSHTHTYQYPNFSSDTFQEAPGGTVALTGVDSNSTPATSASGTGATGSTGSGSSFSIVQQNLGVVFQIKAH